MVFISIFKHKLASLEENDLLLVNESPKLLISTLELKLASQKKTTSLLIE